MFRILLWFLRLNSPHFQEMKIRDQDVVTENTPHILVCDKVVKVQHHQRFLFGQSLQKGNHGIDIISLLVV
jgi:hypothetical protein